MVKIVAYGLKLKQHKTDHCFQASWVLNPQFVRAAIQDLNDCLRNDIPDVTPKTRLAVPPFRHFH